MPSVVDSERVRNNPGRKHPADRQHNKGVYRIRKGKMCADFVISQRDYVGREREGELVDPVRV